MKRMLLIFLISALTAACTRSASSPVPTEPALNFPSPVPGSIPVCQASNLQTSSNSLGASGAITMGVTLTNQSKNPCTLSNPPQVRLLNANGEALKVESTVSPAVQTPAAQSIILLAPTESVILSLVWRNFCQTLPSESVILHLELSEKQELEIKMQMPSAEPQCDASDQTSSLTITPYSFPP
jgi:hypothetical protein